MFVISIFVKCYHFQLIKNPETTVALLNENSSETAKLLCLCPLGFLWNNILLYHSIKLYHPAGINHNMLRVLLGELN
jgi:hypothetical protein